MACAKHKLHWVGSGGGHLLGQDPGLNAAQLFGVSPRPSDILFPPDLTWSLRESAGRPQSQH